MRGQYGGGHGLHLIAMVPAWVQGKPPEYWALRKKAKNHPELWDLAKQLLDQERLVALGKDTKTSTIRRELREKVAANAVAYMGLHEDEPL